MRSVSRGGQRPRQQEPIAQLWAQAAHDLRQPVQAALLVTRTLEVESTQAEQKRLACQAAGALEALCEMLEALALLSRIEAGVQVVPLRICELSEVLKPAMQEMTGLAEERGIRLRFRSIQGLVRSNPKLLVMATRSLLLNAIGLGRGDKILACCRKRGSRLSLEVQFSGAFPEGGNERNAFVQLSPLADRPAGGGLGLGLALLEHLCRRLGHTLHHARLPRNGQLLAIEMPLATNAN